MKIASGTISEISAIGGESKTLSANEGRDLPHYCAAGDCWCSEKLPDSDYPAGCIRSRCEHHRPAPTGGDARPCELIKDMEVVYGPQ